MCEGINRAVKHFRVYADQAGNKILIPGRGYSTAEPNSWRRRRQVELDVTFAIYGLTDTEQWLAIAEPPTGEFLEGELASGLGGPNLTVLYVREQ
jgi:hypothetical protein